MQFADNAPYLVLFPKKNDIYCYPTNKELLTSFPSQLSYFTKALLIDSNLVLHRIVKATKVGWGNSFWGINLLWKERVIRLQLNIDSKVELSLEGAKTLLIDSLESKPFGRFMSEYFESKKLISAIREVDTSAELMNLFLYGIEYGLSFGIIGQLLNNLPSDINTDYRHIAKPWPLPATVGTPPKLLNYMPSSWFYHNYPCPGLESPNPRNQLFIDNECQKCVAIIKNIIGVDIFRFSTLSACRDKYKIEKDIFSD